MTTIVIDIVKGIVYSDSRGTQKENVFTISWRGIKKKEVTSYQDNIKKTFKYKNGHVVTGTGSLELLHKVCSFVEDRLSIVDKKSFFMKSKFELQETHVYVCKSTLGNNYVVRYELTPYNLLANLIYVKIKRRIYKEEGGRWICDGSGKRWAEGSLFVCGDPNRALKALAASKNFDEYSGGVTQEVSFGKGVL